MLVGNIPLRHTVHGDRGHRYPTSFEEWFGDLEESDQDAVARIVDMLEVRGVHLKHPYSSQIKGSSIALRELRIQSGGKPLRVFYAFDPKRQAVVLIGGDKTGDARFYERMVPLSERIWGGVPEGDRAMKKWADIKRAKMSPERIERVRKAALEELATATLRELREESGKTQVELAELTELTQSALSRIERRDDNTLEAIRAYVRALGGEIEVVAVFPNKRVRVA
jgi:DNA-binding XRE family transcriptional regulator